MSVWDNPCYNIEPLRKCVRLYKKVDLKEFPIELDGVANFKTTKAERISTSFSECHFGDRLRDSAPAWREFKRSCFDSGVAKPDPIFTDAVNAVGIDYAGIKAVYWAFAKIWAGDWTTREEYSTAELKEFYSKSWALSPYSSRINASAWLSAGKSIESAITERWSSLDQAAIAVNHFWVIDKTNSYKRHVSAYKRKAKEYPFIKIGSWPSKLELIKFKSGYILNDRRTNESGVFFWKEHDRLVQMLNSVSKCEFYFSTYEVANTALNTEITRAFHKLMDVICEAMTRCNWDQCNYICRALDVCQFLYLSELASDISKRSYNEQLEKIEKEGLDAIIDIKATLDMLKASGLGVKEMLELLKVYRFLPTSDYCPYGVIDNFADKNDNHNVMNLDQEITIAKGKTFKISADEVRRYMKRNMVIMFKERHNRYPGTLKAGVEVPLDMIAYPNVAEGAVTIDNVDLIDIRGAFQWRSYDHCEHELVKDKKTASKTDDVKWYSENQVLQYLFDPDFTPQSEVRAQYAKRKYSQKREINVALKPEAKKPKEKVRAFYMANDPDRRALSEFEANVGEYVTHKPGCSVGKSEKDILERMYEIANWDDSEKRPLLISFDIAGWSPKQDPKFKQMGLDLWAEAFGMDHIPNLADLFNNVTLVWSKFGVSGRYELKGNDLEGFNGKMNTGLHADVMGYAIKKCRELELIDKGGKFACFIDDGLLNLLVDFKTYKRTVKLILKTIEAVYTAFGLEISWDKTFTSEYFMQYLNKVYMDGQEITPGLKAFLRIGKKVDLPSPTLYSELDNLASTVRGAIMAGSDHRVAYAAYLIEIYHLSKYWSRFSADFVVTDAFVASLVVPRNLGGLGISSVFSLSTNETFSALEAGLSAMRTLAIVIPELRSFYEKVLANGVEEMGPLATLKAPRSLRNSKLMLKEERLSAAAVSVVKVKAVNPFIKSVVAAIKLNTVSVCADVLMHTSIVTDFTRDRLWQMDPMNIIDSLVRKLQTSNTASKLIGRTKMASIMIANRYEAARYLVDVSKGIEIVYFKE